MFSIYACLAPPFTPPCFMQWFHCHKACLIDEVWCQHDTNPQNHLKPSPKLGFANRTLYDALDLLRTSNKRTNKSPWARGSPPSETQGSQPKRFLLQADFTGWSSHGLANLSDQRTATKYLAISWCETTARWYSSNQSVLPSMDDGTEILFTFSGFRSSLTSSRSGSQKINSKI